MTSKIFQTFCATTAILFSSTAIAQDATDPVGVITLNVQPGSDAALSAPLHRAADFSGVVSVVDSSSVITVGGTPGWNVDTFASSHYLFVNNGDMEGAFAVVSANSADSVTLSFVSENLNLGQVGGLNVGDRISLIPFWTLGTLYPEDSVPDGTRILLYDRTVVGVNLSSAQSFTYFTGFGWFAGANPGENHPIYPDESYLIRAPASEGIEIALTGSVNVSDFRLALDSVDPGTTQDIRLTSSLPVPVELGSIFGEDGVTDGDRVLFFDNALSGVNKSSSTSAVYFAGFGWFAGATDMNEYMIQPGKGFIYRKNGTNPADVVARVGSPVSE